MTVTYTVADCAQDRAITLAADTDAEALRLVYQTLVGWNDDEPDCSAQIAQGYVQPKVSGAPVDPVWLDRDPAGFWRACVVLMLGDNQDFAAGERSPFAEDEDA